MLSSTRWIVQSSLCSSSWKAKWQILPELYASVVSSCPGGVGEKLKSPFFFFITLEGRIPVQCTACLPSYNYNLKPIFHSAWQMPHNFLSVKGPCDFGLRRRVSLPVLEGERLLFCSDVPWTLSTDGHGAVHTGAERRAASPLPNTCGSRGFVKEAHKPLGTWPRSIQLQHMVGRPKGGGGGIRIDRAKTNWHIYVAAV